MSVHPLLARQIKKTVGEVAGLPPELQQLLALVDRAYIDADEDRRMIRRSMELSSRELVERNGALVSAEEKYRTIFENATEAIFQIAPDGRYIAANPALAQMCGYGTAGELMASVTNVTALYMDPGRWATIAGEIGRCGQVERCESEIMHREGKRLWLAETTRAIRDRTGQLVRYEGTAHDVTATKRAEAERRGLQSQLLEASRQSGMAEVATGVLHNVGNVLNSLEVAWSLASRRVAGFRTANLTKLATLLASHAGDLQAFFAPGAKGSEVPAYLETLAAHLVDERTKIQDELSALGEHLQHVKRVVLMQQSYARNAGVIELVDCETVIEDALRLARTSTSMEGVEIVREYQPLPNVNVDKHHLVEILVNLFTNARQAMQDVAAPPRLLIRLAPLSGDQERFSVAVHDNGMGISKENLNRIFNHGFTTKPNGHGFGLHGAALAASRMQGALRVHSEGPGMGAVFTIELPVNPAKNRLDKQRAA